MSLQTEIETAVSLGGEQAEANALMEIRVNFARDMLIPKMARFVKETHQRVHPVPCLIHKAISYDLAEQCGDEFNNVVNLGGITVKLLPSSRETSVSVFTAYDPKASVLKYIVAFHPLMRLKSDLFNAVVQADGKTMPHLKVEEIGGPAECYIERKFGASGLEVNICNTKFQWPCLRGHNFYDYLNNMWSFAADLTFELAGPIKKGLVTS